MDSKYYERAEDSDLLLKNVLREVKGKKKLDICEVGVGSGYVISNVAKKFSENEYFGSDINKEAIKETKKEFKEIKKDIVLKNKSLFTGFPNKKFDLIFFNTPYLPCEDGEKFEDLTLKDKAIYGGKHGYEIIEEFIYQINDSLKNEGEVLMLFSSLSNQKYIEDVLIKNFFDFEILEKENVFFEDLICMKIVKSEILKKLSEKLINIRYLASGKHSVNLEGLYKQNKVIVKIGKPQHIQIEKMFLEKLQNESFVPKLYFFDDNFVIREKFEGVLIEDFFEKAKKREIVKVINNILRITQRMDEFGINKFEMTNPYKHIYVMDDFSIKMIDYERCLYTQKPKNTTQFFQYLRKFLILFNEKGIELSNDKMFEISRKYKEKHFNFVLEDLFK